MSLREEDGELGALLVELEAEGLAPRTATLAVQPARTLGALTPAVSGRGLASVPRAGIFGAPDLRRDTPAIAPADWRPGFGGNDLEPVACRLYPAVARHLEWLRTRGPARMSGSGACCFAEFAEEAGARAALESLPPGIRGFIARGLDTHPLALT